MPKPNNYLKVRRHGSKRQAFITFNDRLTDGAKIALNRAMTMASDLEEVSIWRPCTTLPGISVIGESRERPKGEWP